LLLAERLDGWKERDKSGPDLKGKLALVKCSYLDNIEKAERGANENKNAIKRGPGLKQLLLIPKGTMGRRYQTSLTCKRLVLELRDRGRDGKPRDEPTEAWPTRSTRYVWQKSEDGIIG